MIAPKSLAAIYRFSGATDDFGMALQYNLHSLGRAEGLDHKVQCFDQAGGCITQLYTMRIVQGTGFLYDCYLFVTPRGARDAKEQQRYRAAFCKAFFRLNLNTSSSPAMSAVYGPPTSPTRSCEHGRCLPGF